MIKIELWVLFLSKNILHSLEIFTTAKIKLFIKQYQLKWLTSLISNVIECFVFPDKLPKKSTTRLCVKIINKTSGPNMIFQWKAFQVWHQDSWFFIPPPLQVIQLLFFNYSLKLKSFLIAVTLPWWQILLSLIFTSLDLAPAGLIGVAYRLHIYHDLSQIVMVQSFHTLPLFPNEIWSFNNLVQLKFSLGI